MAVSLDSIRQRAATEPVSLALETRDGNIPFAGDGSAALNQSTRAV
ncbi:hypothetical protein B4113_0384 [Geobacillus sp. B4113_201601]|nr:hypothetical protein B4113_0384 [Geobacillus sp. B4113_201601]